MRTSKVISAGFVFAVVALMSAPAPAERAYFGGVSLEKGAPVGLENSADSRLVPGMRVRVTVPSDLYWSLCDRRCRLVGNVASVGDGRLMLSYENRDTPLEVPFESVQRMEISRGSRQESAIKGGGIGFLVGASFGLVIGLASGDDSGSFFALTAEQKGVMAGIVLGATGFVVGLIGGAASNEQWEEITDPFMDLDVGVSPQHGGVSLAVSQEF